APGMRTDAANPAAAPDANAAQRDSRPRFPNDHAKAQKKAATNEGSTTAYIEGFPSSLRARTWMAWKTASAGHMAAIIAPGGFLGRAGPHGRKKNRFAPERKQPQKREPHEPRDRAGLGKQRQKEPGRGRVLISHVVGALYIMMRVGADEEQPLVDGPARALH